MKKFLKFGCGTVIALIVLGIIIGALSDTEDTKKEEEKMETVAKDKSDSTNDAKKESDPTEADLNAKDAEIYNKDIVMHLDAFQDEYDKHWANNWVPTFEGVSNGTVDIYEAYTTLNSLEKYYNGLGNKIYNTKLPKLSKDNQKLLKAYLSDFQSAILTRSRAASEAAKMFDSGEFKPSEMEKIKSTVGYADQELLSALVQRTTLEQNLGLIK